jgi:hypothetical protein
MGDWGLLVLRYGIPLNAFDKAKYNHRSEPNQTVPLHKALKLFFVTKNAIIEIKREKHCVGLYSLSYAPWLRFHLLENWIRDK